MRPSAPPELTSLLQAWSDGDNEALDQLAPIVFAELKRIARRQLRHERVDHTLESGALVNEAYLRLINWQTAEWRNRAHFFGMCARMMRQILVDHARGRQYQKRNAGTKVDFDSCVVGSAIKDDALIELDDALKRLAQIHPRKSDVVEMRFFAGLSFEEIGAVLKVSRLTTIRDWNFARAWLRAEMSGDNHREG